MVRRKEKNYFAISYQNLIRILIRQKIQTAIFCFESWVVDTYFGDSDLAKVLQLGNYGPTSSNASSDVIDTKADSMDNTQILPERSSREQ